MVIKQGLSIHLNVSGNSDYKETYTDPFTGVPLRYGKFIKTRKWDNISYPSISKTAM